MGCINIKTNQNVFKSQNPNYKKSQSATFIERSRKNLCKEENESGYGTQSIAPIDIRVWITTNKIQLLQQRSMLEPLGKKNMEI